MPFTGTLRTWNDDRGFGFIAPQDGGREVVDASAFAYGYKALSAHASRPMATAAEGEVAAPALPAANAAWRCDGRTRCSQMRSCDEATFFLRNCPGTQMDGNHDGVPCEQQWCTGP